MSEVQKMSHDIYAAQSVMSDPHDFADQFMTLPDELLDLTKVVQGLVIHPAWSERYGVALDTLRLVEQHNRSVPEILARFRQDGQELTQARPPEARTVGTCRTYSLLLCAMLRYKGIPARTRCGFATYFEPGRYVDHWLCEYWNVNKQHWVKVDAQLDSLQRRALSILFNPLDVPKEHFVSGGEAWRMCREGRVDPGRFGIFDMHGPWFVRGNVVRDLAALNKVELLPWDAWGLVDKPEEELTVQDRALIDQAATLGSTPDLGFSELQQLYQANEGLRVPLEIRSYTAAGLQRVRLPSELVTNQ